MLLVKSNSLLSIIKMKSEEDSSPLGFFKWVAQIDHLAQDVLYDISEDETKIEETVYIVKNSGSLYKCLENIFKMDILSEDYIKQLLQRYNHTKSDRNKDKLELICFKNHHLVFYHITDVLRLVWYLCFKTPTLGILYHFVNDRILLTHLKQLFINICDILGTKEYLEFYIKVLPQIEKRIKDNKNKNQTWVDWIMESINQNDYEKVDETIDEDDNPIHEGEQNEDGFQDDEDMYIILSNINDIIIKLFSTWDRIFILHGKSTENFDCYSALLENNLLINTKRIEFQNSLQDAELLQKSQVYKTDDLVEAEQLYTVKSIISVLDINMSDEMANWQQ